MTPVTVILLLLWGLRPESAQLDVCIEFARGLLVLLAFLREN
jgi:hypothetical protein